jgi:hypothetical protein
MPVGEPKTSVVERRTGVKSAAMEYRTAGSETTAMECRATSETAAVERRAAASETAAVECSAATMHSPAAMEPASSTMESAAAASTVETTSAAVPAAAATTPAVSDLGYHPPGGFGDRRCARTNQRHRLGALAWCGRQRQHRRRCKTRAQDVTHRTACGA